jgi:hypothetical protein
MSKEIKVTLTAEFAAAVKAYQEANGIPSLPKAIAQLAAIGYEVETGEPAPIAVGKKGGWRGNKKSLENLVHYVDKITNYGQDDPTE